ncbi:transposase [Clostridium sp. D2Q-14]|uniref:transposase n=1 Tax=Anaeromonas gelatinilytica TaxID=2683194 RepID=UPI00193BCF24|nr:transposase [Anaeromonas gelatinilytica]MBS4535039.1 transposase [Anaeromonas gelatinilytica]
MSPREIASLGTNESSYVWEENLRTINRTIKSYSVEEILLGVMDGLTSFSKVFNRAYPKTDIQSYIVYKVHYSLKSIRKKDISEFATDLKEIYESPSLDLAKNSSG